MSIPEFRSGLGRVLESQAISLRLLPAQSAISLGDLSTSFGTPDGADLVLVDCHDIRAAAMCRAVTRIRLSGWTGPIFVIAGDQSIPKIPIAMTLGAAEFAHFTTSVEEMEIRISQLASRDADRRESVTTVPLPDGAALSIHWRRHVVTCGNTRVGLTLRELQLFGALVENVGRTFSSPEIAALAWGREEETESMTAVYISSLRKKLAWFGNRFGIRTIRLEGYRFEIPLAAPQLRADRQGHND